MTGERFRINVPAVIHQVIDGEAVIIHLDRGLYYSLDALGAEIWERVAAGSSPGQIADSLASGYDTDRATFSDAVATLLERLGTEELIVPVPGTASDESTGGPNGTPPDGPAATPDATAPRPFSPPRLQRYDDLQELLLLDPIHAVDESGWPERPATETAQAGADHG